MFYYENGEMVTYWNSLIFRGSPLESGSVMPPMNIHYQLLNVHPEIN